MLKANLDLDVHHKKELIIIAKGSSRPTNPIQWNVLAIVFILGFMPFATAYISNAGANSDEAWVSSMTDKSDGGFLWDSSMWVENGGLNMTQWYNDFHPSSTTDRADCIYITKSNCEGVYDDSGLINNQPEQWKPLRGNPSPYAGGGTYTSNDYFSIRSTQVHQTHFDIGNLYALRSGSEIFAWNLSSNFNQINQGETLDSIRYWMVSSQSYACSYSGFANITFGGSITFKYGNDSIEFSNFEFSKNTKFQYAQIDTVAGNWNDVCGVGFIIEFDLTGFESLALHSMNGAGDWDNTSIYLELTDFVNTDNSESVGFHNTALPFAGHEYWTLGVQHKEINPVEAGFVIKTGTLILSVMTFVLALGSTTYWNPFRDFFKGGIF